MTRRSIYIVLALLIIAAAILWISGRGSSPTAAPEPTPSPTSAAEPDQPAVSSSTSTPGTSNRQDQMLRSIETTLQALQKNRDPEATRAALEELRRELRDEDPVLAIAAIRAFLATGADAETGLGFEIAEGGLLAESPSLRVFLLDELGQLSRSAATDDAVAVARDVLSSKNSADEWAVSLRNAGWAGETALLQQKTREMLQYEPWLAKPSAGFLEAFDTVVHTRDIALVPRIAELANRQGPLEQASRVALDRLSETASLEMMTFLNNNPQILSDLPLIRADYYTKADLADPQQRQAVENFLARPATTSEEKVKILEGLTAPGSFVSDNLLTQTPLPPADPAARDKVVEQVFREWQSRFPQLAPTLTELIDAYRSE